MEAILLNSATNVSVTDVNLPIMVVAELVVFVALLVGVWSTLKNKTMANYQSSKDLKEQLDKHMEDCEKKFNFLRTEHSEAYTKLENKITGIEKQVNGISNGIANIEGYIKAMCDQSNNN